MPAALMKGGIAGVCGEIWALPPYLHREGLHCNSSPHHCSTMFAQVFAGVFAQIFVYMYCYALLSKYVPKTWIANVLHRFCTDSALMMHRQGAHFNCNHHRTGKGRGCYVLSLQVKFLSDWHRNCTDIAHVLRRYCILQMSAFSPMNFGAWKFDTEKCVLWKIPKKSPFFCRRPLADIVDGVSYQY